MKLHIQKAVLRSSRSAWLVLVVSMLLVLFAGQAIYQKDRGASEKQFNLNVRDEFAAINARMRQHEQILLGGAGLFDSSQRVNRKEWSVYIDRLQMGSKSPGIQGVGYSVVIQPEELEAHIKAVRAEGFPEYAVRPKGPRALYTSIIYLEPFEGRNLAAFGYDMYSEPTRAQAMRIAGETGETTISGKVRLVQETHGKEQAGFLMYVPIYRKNQPMNTAQERWKALQGFVYSPYRIGDLMRGLLGQSISPLNFKIFDGLNETAETLMYDSGEFDETGQSASPSPELTASRILEAYGRKWTVRFDSRPEHEVHWLSQQNVVLLVLGGGFSVLLFAFVSSMNSRRENAESLAKKMTAEIRSTSESLRHSQQLLDSIVENIPLEIFVKRANDFKYEFVNRAWEAAHNTPRAEMIGWDDYDFFSKALADRIRDTDKKAMASEELIENPESHIRYEDGTERILHTMKLGLRNEAGEPTHILGMALEVTKAVYSQRALKEAAQQTQAILDNVVDGIVTIDALGAIRSFNKAAETIFGYAVTEVMGQNINMLMPEPYHSEHDGYLENYRQTGIPRIIGKGREVVGRRKDGSTFPMDLAVSASQQHGVPLFVGLVRDITERKRIDQMKGEFVSTVSHELRTPLTSISGALGLVCGGALGPVTEQAKIMLDIAYKNSQRLTHLINDLLDMEKLVAGQMRFELQTQEIMPLVEQSVETMKTYAQQHRVELVIKQRADGAKVRVDASRLQQVLSNFLSNAAKFSPEGGTVQVGVREDKGVVRVEVQDHGQGIPPEFHKRIFQKFSQADSSDTRQKGGTGLGLAISKELIERMNGMVGFVSQPGQGARFHFELPSFTQDMQAQDIVIEEIQGAPYLLVVEDDPDIARLLVLLLSRAGFNADVAGSGEAVFRKLSQRRYVAITLDLLLPDQSGVSIIRQLRSMEAYENLPIIVVSAYMEDGKLSINGDFAAVDWIDKPIEEKKLIDAVRRCLLTQSGTRVKVLHVEDDADLHLIVSTLGRDVAEFDVASSLSQARERLAQARYDLVVLDIGLPDGSGWDLLPVINALQPAPQVIVLSGVELNDAQRQAVYQGLLKSHASTEGLLDTIRQAIKKQTHAAT